MDGDVVPEDILPEEFQPDDELSVQEYEQPNHNKDLLDRRSFLKVLSITTLLVAAEYANLPIPEAKGQTVPRNPEIENFKQWVQHTNESFGPLLPYRLLLPTIETTDINGNPITEIDWHEAYRSHQRWGNTHYLIQGSLPSPSALILAKGVPTAFICGEEDAPLPIGVENTHNHDQFGWALARQTDDRRYFATTHNGTPEEDIDDIITKLENGENLAVRSEGTTTLPYELMLGPQISTEITRLIEQNPDMAGKIKFATGDNFVSPPRLFDSPQISSVHVQNTTNIEVIGDKFDEPPFGFNNPVHSALSMSAARKLLGNEAGMEITSTIGYQNTAITDIIEDRLSRKDHGEPIPLLTTLNVPFDFHLGVQELMVRGREYTWHDKEFMGLLKSLNIVAVISLGNSGARHHTESEDFKWEDEEHRQLFLDTHLAATQGWISGDNELYIDPYKGLPSANDKTLQDAAFVSHAGELPAIGFRSYHVRDASVDLSETAPPLTGFRHGLIPHKQDFSGSSAACVAVAAQLSAFAMAEGVSEGEMRGYEFLRKFKEAMKPRTLQEYNNPNNSMDLRVVDYDLLLKKLRKATGNEHPIKLFIPATGA